MIPGVWSFARKDSVLLVLLCLQPVMNFIAHNIDDLGFSPSRAIVYLFVIAGLSLAFVWIVGLALSPAKKTFLTFFVGLSVLATLNAGALETVVLTEFVRELLGIVPRFRYSMALYLLSIAACAGVAYGLLRLPRLRDYALVLLVAVAVTDLGTVGYRLGKRVDTTAEPVVAAAPVPTISPRPKGDLPNIYYILPDMMVGTEMFERFGIPATAYDNLRALGFNTIEAARSNAPITEYSLPLLYAMDYFLRDGERVSRAKLDRIVALSGRENLVHKRLRAYGYRIVEFADGYMGGCNAAADQCISRKNQTPFTVQDSAFIARTPFTLVINEIDAALDLFPVPFNLWPFPNRIEFWEVPKFLPDPKAGPTFYFVHLGLPHPPFRFDAQCQFRRFVDQMTRYTQQARCAANAIERLAKGVRDRDPTAFVVIQADHGALTMDQAATGTLSLSDEQILENVSIFSAFRLPTRCQQYLRPGLSPVNTFRIVFACLDNKPPKLVEDRVFMVYYSNWKDGNIVREWRGR